MTGQENPKELPAAAAAARSLEQDAGPRALVVLLVIGVLGVLFAWNSWKRDFWDPSEPRLALIAREMGEGAGWWIPTLGGEPYLDQPPVACWLPAAAQAAGRLAGWDPRFSYRLPVTLAACLGLWLTYTAGKKLFDGRTGFLAACIEASTYFFNKRSSWLDDDLFFAVGCQLALTSFVLASRPGERRWWPLLGWTGLALAALSKSLLLALGLVFAPLLLYFYFRGGVALVKRGFGALRSAPAMGIFLLLVGSWTLAAGWAHGGRFLDAHVLGQHWARLFHAGEDRQPIYFYAVSVFLGFLPWSIFLPLALLHGKDRLQRDGERLAFFWAGLAAAGLSIVSAKKAEYMLVIWPALSLLVSASLLESKERFSVWEEWLREGVFRAVPRLLQLPLFLVLAAAAAYFAGFRPKLEHPELRRLLADPQGMRSTLALAAAAGLLLFVASRRLGRLVAARAIPRAAFELSGAALFLFFIETFAYQGLNDLLSARPGLEKLAREVPAGAPLSLYGRKRPEVFYYLGKRLDCLSYPDPKLADDPARRRLEEYLKQPQVAFILGSKSDLEWLAHQFPSLSPWLLDKAEARLGWREDFKLKVNRPP